MAGLGGKKAPQREVICPHCRAEQMQPEEAISTTCRSCGKYFKLHDGKHAKEPAKDTGHAARVAAAKSVHTRSVVCGKCRTLNKVTDAALSTQCMKCANYLDLRDQVIRGTSTERVHTYGEVTFAAGSLFRGFSVEATRIEILGKVSSRLEAAEQITVASGSQVSGEIRGKTIVVQRGAVVAVELVVCRRLVVEGQVDVNGTVEAQQVIVNRGGNLRARRFEVQEVEVEQQGFMNGRVEIRETWPEEVIFEETEE